MTISFPVDVGPDLSAYWYNNGLISVEGIDGHDGVAIKPSELKEILASESQAIAGEWSRRPGLLPQLGRISATVSNNGVTVTEETQWKYGGAVKIVTGSLTLPRHRWMEVLEAVCASRDAYYRAWGRIIEPQMGISVLGRESQAAKEGGGDVPIPA